MYRKLLRGGHRLIRYFLSSLLGGVIVLLVVAVFELEGRPDLYVWHTAELDEEFSADSGLTDFSEYLELENRLFDQLDQQVYQKIDSADQSPVNRYFRGSLSDPDRWPTNWNRSFVMPAGEPRIAVLLLHGMSDSPYSTRSLAAAIHNEGAYVIGLRVPGHGQAPSGLLKVHWEDMAEAVRLAINELKKNAPDRPLYILGYSNGGALAVHYALSSLSDDSLVKVDGLVLLSPEIGISKLAALAKWQQYLGRLLGLEKLAWNSLQPEYDPYKYGSFALNAGEQAYRITQEIQAQIGAQSDAGNLERMPPILAFQSVVDATVKAPELVSNLFDRLPAVESSGENPHSNHELVLFDINRFANIQILMRENPTAWLETLRQRENMAFMLTLLSNQDREDRQVIAASRAAGTRTVTECNTGLSWPDDVYSLTHVALPFPPDDPVYGGANSPPSPGIKLGQLAMRGERNVLYVSGAEMLRLRYNPFHEYMQRRIFTFLGLTPGTAGSCQSTVAMTQ